MTDAVSGVPAEGSATPGPSAPNIVTIDCSCVGKPHETDTVILAPEVPLELGMAAAYVLSTATEESLAIGALSSLYLRFAIIAWTLVDEKGQPEPVTPENALRRLPYRAGGYEVAERANNLYQPLLMRPLQAARARSSHITPQDHLTSAKNGSGRKHRTPSAPSSPRSKAGQPSAVPAP
jgi:hypothetical protein